MLLADMMVRAIDAALQDGEVALNRVGVCTTANALASAVIDRLMLLKLRPDTTSYRPTIWPSSNSHQSAFGRVLNRSATLVRSSHQ